MNEGARGRDRFYHDLIRCPACLSQLKDGSGALECVDPACRTRYPVVGDVPVMIPAERSLFSVESVAPEDCVAVEGRGRSGWRPPLPSLSANVRGRNNYERYRDELRKLSDEPRVLVIGGSILGQGMEVLSQDPGVSLVETDVVVGPRTAIVCDAHCLPFSDESFDGVVIQAVLEHVVDPACCCAEIHRVLRPRGVVYAETPFMQPTHEFPYDFTRFTYLGHRLLFRDFDEIDSGAVCGTGMALAYSYQSFLVSLTRKRVLRGLLRAFAAVTAFHLKYFDYLTIDNPSTLYGASGFYFMGSRSSRRWTSRELITEYSGRCAARG